MLPGATGGGGFRSAGRMGAEGDERGGRARDEGGRVRGEGTETGVVTLLLSLLRMSGRSNLMRNWKEVRRAVEMV